jgi:hypothetical protein
VTNARRVSWTVVVTMSLVVSACSTTAPPTAGQPSAAPSESTGVAVATPAAPTGTAASAQPPTPAASSNAPLAFLLIGPDRHVGEVGGFTFGRSTDSAPWLPATALETVRVQARAELRVKLDDRATIDDWAARIATAADVTADAVTSLGGGVGPVAAFAAPSAGDWVVSVTITYDQGLGSGAYYWHLIVE